MAFTTGNFITIWFLSYLTVGALSQSQTTKLLCPDMCVASASVTGSRKPGDVVTIACAKGYHLIGDDELTCGTEGQWKGVTPTCEKDHICPGVPGISYGSAKYTTNAYFPGGSITFSCDSGYALKGQEKITCQANGGWDHQAPVCVAIKCDHIKNVDHGYIDNYSQSPGSSITVVCDAGYKATGSPSLTCDHHGRWSAPAPSCVRNTAVPDKDTKKLCPYPIIENGECYGDRAPGKLFKCTCNAGFVLIGSPLHVCDADLTWQSGNFPKCQDRCPHVSVFENGMVIGYDNKINGNTARFLCFPGFTLNGVKGARCNSQAAWSARFPTCVPASTCDVVPCLLNGHFERLFRGKKTSLYYMCDAGYQLQGAVQRQCSEDQWDAQPPVCQERPEGCAENIWDIFFVIDTSRSISELELEEENDALHFIINAFNIDDRKSRFGVITYTKYVKIVSELGKYSKKNQIDKLQLISRPRDFESGTPTADAMKAMMAEFAKAKKRGRGQLSILITDGRATQPKELMQEMISELLKTDIKSVAIGVGNNIDATELAAIASGDGLDNVHMVTNFSQLASMAQQLVGLKCDESTELILAEPAVKCNDQSLMVAFAVDISKSIDQNELEQERMALKYLISKLNYQKSQFSVIKYGHDAQTEFQFGDITSNEQLARAELLARPKNMSHVKGGTNTPAAVNMALDLLDDNTNTKKVCILLTDGKSTTSLDALLERLASSDVKVICIGIGHKANKEELQSMATGHGEQNVFIEDNFEDLKSKINDVMNDACDSETSADDIIPLIGMNEEQVLPLH